MNEFTQLFESEPEVVAEAHGRTNLIGEHTDYNGGYVLPILIPQKTQTELQRRADRSVYVFSETERRDGICGYRLGEEKRRHGWLDYVQGITRVLQESSFAITGFNARLKSDLPSGSGLSSSAALEVSLLRALRVAFDLKIGDVDLALIGQRAENEFVGANVGIMDQMAASVGSESSALFLDTKTLEYRSISLPESLELVVIHSGSSHQIRDGAYNRRREECERACGYLQVKQLRDLTLEDLARMMQIPDPFGRRARHVITENQRVLEAASALQKKDLRTFGNLLNLSHISMKDDFEVSITEIDVLVEIAQSHSEVYGARLTGGGFGGSIVIAAKAGCATNIAREILSSYSSRTGRTARILFPV